MRTAGLMGMMFVLGSAAAAAPSPLPGAAGKAIASAVGTAAYLPRSVPAGYRYLRWKNVTAGRSPLPGDTIFIHAELTKARGNRLAKAKCHCVVNDVVVSEGELMFTFLER